MGIWQRYQNWRHRHVAALLVTLDGFAIRQAGESRAYRWDDVERITAMKRDLFAYDCICLILLLSDGIVEVNEDMRGFAGFREAMELHLAIQQDWWMQVAFPAFAACPVELFSVSRAQQSC